ncbi:MAG: toxin TcdB middle/C-terminal domain-containing protein, partial [Vicinamibacterales bacterium]
MLRQELYALDGTVKAGEPYVVTEQNFTIRCLQPRGSNRHAVFFSHAREALSCHYERNAADPRTSHALTLEVDEFGNVLTSLAIGYGRKQSPLPQQRDRRTQTATLLTLTENRFTNAIDDSSLHPDDYRTPLQAEARTYELTGFTPENSASRFSFDEWTRNAFALLASAADIPYEQKADITAKQKRLIEHLRTRYRKNDLTALSPLGVVESHALSGETYRLALTPGLIASVFKRTRSSQPDEDLLPSPAALLEGTGEDQGGYVAMDGNWWVPSGRVFYSDVASHTAAQELAVARAHFFLPRRYRDQFGHEAMVVYDGPTDPNRPRYDLLVTTTRDALNNTVTAVHDYRVLQPRLVTDPNGNRTAGAFDALGLVVATAVMGKPNENLGDLLEGFETDPPLADLRAFIADPRAGARSLLGKATTRTVYDLARYERAGQAPLAATLTREVHYREPGGPQSRIQVSFAYSDGYGREVQRKIQAEAGDAPQRKAPVTLSTGDVHPGDLVRDAQGKVVLTHAPRRWVGSGRTVFNNKGKPVKQYEPFFSSTHLHEPEREMTDTGVSPVLFYDPVERVVATLHPNHTYEKIVFDPWRQTTYDVNDTAATSGAETGDPRTDPDISGHVHEYFNTQPGTWRTWHALRIGNTPGDPERDAAEQAAAHAATPTVAHVDALGRPFLTIAHNRYGRNGAVIDEQHAARVELDIEGNQREIRDATDRLVMRYDYDMLGRRIRQASMEAGERWLVNDVTGKAVRTWDTRLFLHRLTYDALRRSTGLYVTENGTERLAERTVYGESQGESRNHRARVYRVLDQSGVVTNVAYDFKGNVLEGQYDLLNTYKGAVNWLQNPSASGGRFTSHTTYDALNRPRTVTSPDGSVYRATFNDANLLDKVEVNLRGASTATPFVTNIDYDAKGRRERIDYGNGAVTTCRYDPLTFRLTNLKTSRPPGPGGLASQIFTDATVVQDLRYTYDPAGNLTRVEDAALETVFHGQQIDPAARYIYDALYRLIEAHGREHIGQTALSFTPPSGNYRDHPFAGSQVHPNDLQAIRNFTQRYEYDAVGNFGMLRHVASGGSWTRRYDYQETSLLEAAKRGNRLTSTTVGNGITHVEAYTHDAHGNMSGMPHLAAMDWDFEDQLERVDLGGGGRAYYVYDRAGQRVRKVIESRNGARQKERIYLGGFEIYREYNGNGSAVVLERESLHVMDDKQRVALVETLTMQNGSSVGALAPLQRYQLGNHLGSASVELDESGALVSYEEYHPYGTTAFQAGRSAAEVSLKRYRYTGKERDEETGFAYHDARYYAPWLGRWTSCDPTGLDDGI